MGNQGDLGQPGKKAFSERKRRSPYKRHRRQEARMGRSSQQHQAQISEGTEHCLALREHASGVCVSP